MADTTTWQITAQATNQTTINQAGNVIEGVIVYFITGEGNEGSVFIANTQFTEARVKVAVDEAALKLDRVGRLRGQVS